MAEISGTMMDEERGIGASSENNHVIEPEEVMNRLPEDIQRYIVSTLPMEDAVRTSILSSKWRKIWYSHPCLIFDYQDFPNMEAKAVRFEEFIDQTVLHHDASTIEELVLKLFAPYGPYPCIRTEWVTFALEHKVQYLILDGMMKDQERLPHCLFTSKSLVTLNLSVIGYALKWPTVVLPNLTELTLRGLRFEEENLTLDLSSSCPSLERLKIMSCNLSHVKLFSISAPVEYLEIRRCIGIHGCEVKLRTPFLDELEYDNELAHRYDFASISPDFYAIIKFHGAIPLGRSGDDIGRCAIDFYRELQNVSRLMLNHWFIEFLCQGRDLLLKTPTSYDNLVYMKVAIWSITKHLEMLIIILSRCPNLHSLKIIISRSSIRTASVSDFKWEDMVNCEMFNHLEYLKVGNLSGRKDEMDLVQFLLLKACELKEIKFVPPRTRPLLGGKKVMDISEDSWMEITGKVLEFEKSSTNAIVSFL